MAYAAPMPTTFGDNKETRFVVGRISATTIRSNRSTLSKIFVLSLSGESAVKKRPSVANLARLGRTERRLAKRLTKEFRTCGMA